MQSGEFLRERYRIIELIGQGPVSAVYLAMDHKTREIVAVKVVEGGPFTGPFETRFRREARFLNQLQDPHVVRMRDFGLEGSRAFVVTDYVPGRSLAELLRERGPATMAQVLDVARQVAVSLKATWKDHLVHGHLKPSNVLLDNEGAVRILDFDGVRNALSAAGAPTGEHELPLYISPEQAEGHTEIDIRADIYSLGVILFELLTGRTPYDGDKPGQVAEKHLRAPIPTVSTYRPDTPPIVDRFVEKCLQKKPEDRPASPSALLSGLDRVREEQDKLDQANDVPHHGPPEAGSVLFTTQGGRQIRVSGGTRMIRIGRADASKGIVPEVDIAAEDPDRRVSRRQAQVLAQGGAWVFSDEPGVRHPSYVNGRQLGPGDTVRLQDGDRIKLGNVELTFRLA